MKQFIITANTNAAIAADNLGLDFCADNAGFIGTKTNTKIYRNRKYGDRYRAG